MSEYYGFENLECWKQAKDLAVDMYKLSADDGLNGDSVMCDQLRRSSLAVMNHIADGKNRGSRREFMRMLQIAKGSAAALQSNLILSRDIGYLGEGDFLDFQDRANRVAALIGGLINAIKRQQQEKQLEERQAVA